MYEWQDGITKKLNRLEAEYDAQLLREAFAEKERQLPDRLAQIQRQNFEELTADEIAERLGMPTEQVKTTTKALGVRFIIKKEGLMTFSVLPEFTLDLLIDEQRRMEGADGVDCAESVEEQVPPIVTEVLVPDDEPEWQGVYDSLEEHITIDKMWKVVGKSRGWVERRIEALGITPAIHQTRTGHPDNPLYAKEVALFLKREADANPLDNGWVNLRQLEQITGQDREWIANRLQEANIVPESRCSSLSGHTLDFYPPESAELIQNAADERPELAADWLTEEGLTNGLQKSLAWVRNRLAQYKALAEDRRDEHGVTRVHYPPHVFAELEQVKNFEQSLPDAGDYLTFYNLVSAIGRSALLVANRIEELGIKHELRRGGRNRITPHFPPESVGDIKGLIEKQESSDLITTTQIAVKTKKTIADVRQRLKELGIEAVEIKRAGNGSFKEHYSPDCIELLLAEKD